MEPATQKPCPGPHPPRLVRCRTAHPLPPTAPPTPIPPRPTCTLTSQHRRGLTTPQVSLSSFRTVAPCLAQGRGPRTPRAGKGGRRGCPEALRYTVAVTTKLINFTKEGGGRSTRPEAPVLSGTQRGPQAVASAGRAAGETGGDAPRGTPGAHPQAASGQQGRAQRISCSQPTGAGPGCQGQDGTTQTPGLGFLDTFLSAQWAQLCVQTRLCLINGEQPSCAYGPGRGQPGTQGGAGGHGVFVLPGRSPQNRCTFLPLIQRRPDPPSSPEDRVPDAPGGWFTPRVPLIPHYQ